MRERTIDPLATLEPTQPTNQAELAVEEENCND